MDEKLITTKIDAIFSDQALPLMEKLELLLGLSSEEVKDSESNDKESEENAEEMKKEMLKRDALIYRAAIDLVKRENSLHEHDLTLMQLYVLLAETYNDLYDYRPMKQIATEVLYLMRDNSMSVEVLKETVPRLAEAIGNSVYNHALFEILLRYVKKVVLLDPEYKDIKRQARKLLKLNILLDSPDRYTNIWTKELEAAVASLFTPEELVRIIVRPQIGHLRRDPVEYTWKWEEIYYDVEEEIDRRFANAPDFMGHCFQIWSVKKELLKEVYGIDWHTPSQMNPHVMFD